MPYLIAFFAVFLLFNKPAAADDFQPRGLCGEREKIVATLENRYSEEISSMGLSGSGAVLEVFISDKGSWTIIMTRPTGRACIISAGDAWENIKGPGKLEEKI